MKMNLFLEKKEKRNKDMENSRRQNRIRYKLKKVSDRKRLTVFKSNKHLYVQVVNDEKGLTICSVSSMEKNFRDNKQTKKELAEKIGTEIAKRSIKNGLKEVAFDKGKYKYHGLIKILADSARTEGLNF